MKFLWIVIKRKIVLIMVLNFRGNVFRDRRYRYFEFSRSLLLSYSLYVGLLVDEGEDYYGVYFVYDMIGRLFYGFLVFR